MDAKTDELLSQLSELSLKDRGEIAHEILVSLDELNSSSKTEVAEPRAIYGEMKPHTTAGFSEIIRTLSYEEQEFIVRELLWQISENFPRQYESDEALEAELKRRIESIENGTAVLIPAEQAFAELREKYGLPK